MPSNGFNKFIHKPVKGAKIKEAIRQEKKAATKERREAIDKHFEEKRKQRAQQSNFENINKKSNIKNASTSSFEARNEAKSFKKNYSKNTEQATTKRTEKPFNHAFTKPAGKSFSKAKESNSKKSFTSDKPAFKTRSVQAGRSTFATQTTSNKKERQEASENEMPLNKFIAHAGICSRRDAADLVRKGSITVDGKKITEPAFKVTDKNDVKIDGKKIARSRNHVYILLNKPKDYITTADDPQGRKTVMDIIKNATTERVYPVGRLDRNTSGVLLLTNDGDMAQKLSHPSFEVKKVYEVKLNKVLQKNDFEKILNGVQLEDGEVHADSLAYADSKDKSIVGIEIHSGKNRVVRRIFEKLGYDVRGLDRVMYANLTKKNVERGKWRFLNEKEIRLLKYFNKSKQK